MAVAWHPDGKETELGVREPDSDDREFAISTWSRSYKDSRSAGILPTDEYATIMHRTLKRILQRPTTRTIIAFELTDPSFIYGFIAGDTSARWPVVYYVYVKDGFREQGCARALFNALGVDPVQPFAYACDTTWAFRLKHLIPYAKHIPNVARYNDTRSIEAWRP